MAKVPVSAKAAAKRLKGKRKRTGPTLIQRSRSVSSEEKAIFHNVTGAGKSRVKREFLGLDDGDAEVLGQQLEKAVAMRLGRVQS